MFIFLSVLITLIILFILIWYTNLGGLKEKVLIHLVVKMRVSPKRLKNVKSPLDYGMDYQDVNILTPDNIRLSAWLISPKNNKDHTIIINHALTTTRYGALKGLDNVSVEYLPMVKHLYDEGYNVLFYDQRGQGDSDGGLGKNQVGKQAPVGAGMTEWQDVIGAVQYVKHHPKLKNNQISFIAHCMGANALFLAWHKEPLLFNQFNIQSIIAIQPTISIKMFGRLLKSMVAMDIADKVEKKQMKTYGFGFAETQKYVQSVNVPILFLQVKKDKYTFDPISGKNDIELIMNESKTEHNIIWIGKDEKISFGNDQRFDGYAYFNRFPKEMLEFLDKKSNRSSQ